MVPLIDMFFLLLVFFIFGVFSMTTQQGLLVDLPAARTAAPAANEEALTVSVTAEGALFLNQAPVGLSELPARLQQAARMPDPIVTVSADRRVAHGTVIAVLDGVRQAGLSRVSFQATTEER